MKRLELKLTRIGNSRGIRLPAEIIAEHQLQEGVVLEVRSHELVLKPKKGPRKLSWEETAKEMAEGDEDWSDWEKLPDGWAEA